MNLEFKSSPYKSWQSREIQNDSYDFNTRVYVSGWISTDRGVLMGKDFAEFILCKIQNNTSERLREDLIYLFNNRDGNFAIVAYFDSKVWAITDLVRTIPLFWHIKND